MASNWFKHRKFWFTALTFIFLLAFYVGSYLYLSRRGMSEAKLYNASGFFYCPISELVPYGSLPRQHQWALSLYTPLNKIDQAWFGGGSPCCCVIWGFGQPMEAENKEK